MTIMDLAEVTKEQVDIAGGKGANLGELINTGFPVPPGFVIGADEYSAVITHLDIPANDDFPEDSNDFLENIRNQILATQLSDNLTRDIALHHEALATRRSKEQVYAVRSSATAEDLADASYAGQHDTYYYVSPDSLVGMVKKCWASLWSEAAFSLLLSPFPGHRTQKR